MKKLYCALVLCAATFSLLCVNTQKNLSYQSLQNKALKQYLWAIDHIKQNQKKRVLNTTERTLLHKINTLLDQTDITRKDLIEILQEGEVVGNKREKLVIIGSGPAGLTAALYAARSKFEPLVIDGSQPGGQLTGTSYVENWPGDTKILGYELMENMREHAQHFGTRYHEGQVEKVTKKDSYFICTLKSGQEIEAESIIIATGAQPRKLGIPGESEYWGSGVGTCTTCDGAFYANKKVIIIGGGDSAMEKASFMKKFTNDITIVQLLETLTASQSMQDRVLQDKDITIIYDTAVIEVKGDGDTVTSIVIENQKNHEQQEIPADGVFLAIGMKPNTDFVKELVELDHGYIVHKNYTQTSVPGIFAAGDVVDYRYRQAITSSGEGCKAALDVEKYLNGQEL